MRFNSIIGRIVWLHIIVVGSVSVLMPLALYMLLASETDQIHRQFIADQADQLSQYLHFDAGKSGQENNPNVGKPAGPAKTGEAVTVNKHWRLNLPDSMESLYSVAYGRYRYAVLDEDGAVLFSSLPDNSAIFPDAGLTSAAVFFDRSVAGASVSGARIPKTIAGHELWIDVAEDLSHRDVIIDDIVGNFLRSVIWVTLPLLLLLLGFDIAIVRSAFKPILKASDEAENISPAKPGIRLSSSLIPKEILPLVTAMNNALDRLEAGFQMQREFAADAAHELRTPLAVLHTRIDTLTDKQVSAQLRDDVARMTRTVNQLLEMAESETYIVGPDERADLHATCVDVVAFLAPLVFEQGKSISVTGAEMPVWVIGNPEMVARAVRNLVENAIKYSPAGGDIEVAVAAQGAVRVIDQGPGIGDDEKQLLFRRFWRRDRRGPNSLGLGLSIVQRIMEAHAGTIDVPNRSPRGTEFVLTFRPADAQPSS